MTKWEHSTGHFDDFVDAVVLVNEADERESIVLGMRVSQIRLALVSLHYTGALDPTGVNRALWTLRWKPALKTFAITFQDRWPNTKSYQ
ncbi:hypothetical protein H4V99_003284 [Cryobacterium sp. CG_9.6]|nr:hypothetical protein [Cryobacterium sp. CG_9.6]